MAARTLSFTNQLSLPFTGNREAYTKNSFLIATLYGLRSALSRGLGLKHTIDFSFSDGQRQLAMLRGDVKYPRYWITPTGIDLRKDQGNQWAMAKSGIQSHSVNAGEGVKEAKIFPVELVAEFHYVTSDILDMLQTSEALLMLSAAKTYGFSIVMEQGFETQSRIIIEDDLTFNNMEMTGSIDPNTVELIAQMRVQSYVGYITDKPWVHTVDGTEPIDYNAALQQGE